MTSWVTKYRQVVAHRGNSWEYPENTRAAILSAVEIKADVIEFDISLTSDNVAIALHGPKLQKSTTGRGKARNYSRSELEKATVLNRQGQKTNEPIPSLKDLLCEFGDKALWNLDIKDIRAVPLVISLIEELSLKGRVVLSGLGVRQVRELSFKYPNVDMLINLSRLDKFFLFSRILSRRWIMFRFSDITKSPSVVGINVHWRYVNQKLVNVLDNLGTEIWVFTVDSADRIERMFCLGVNSVTTNCPTLYSSIPSNLES